MNKQKWTVPEWAYKYKDKEIFTFTFWAMEKYMNMSIDKMDDSSFYQQFQHDVAVAEWEMIERLYKKGMLK